MSALRRTAVRLLSSAGVLLLLLLALFVAQRLLPGDPARAYAGRSASPAQLADARETLGLDRPIWVQFGGYLADLARGDLGRSITTRDPVAADIGAYLPATLELVGAALLVTAVLGTAVGLVGSRSGPLSAVVRVASITGASAASFLVGVLALVVLYQALGWFPAGGRSSAITASSPTGLLVVDTLLAGRPDLAGDALRHLVLPAAVLALTPIVAVGRTLQGGLRGVLRADFMRSAEARGEGPWALRVRHGLRNAANPALSMAGLQIGVMLVGSVVVEQIFSWPGLGGYLSRAISESDLPAVTGVVLVFGVAYVLVNLVVDLLQPAVDPRLRGRA